MDRLISEQEVIKVIDSLKANFTCYDSVTLDEVYSHVKAIPSAEPYKGMTNGEVIIKIFPYILPKVFDGTDDAVIFSLDWWNSPYKKQERSK